jgi:hypothetical protein
VAKYVIGDRPAVVVRQREIKVVAAGRSRHGSDLPGDRRAKGRSGKEVSCGAGGGPGGRSPNIPARDRCTRGDRMRPMLAKPCPSVRRECGLLARINLPQRREGKITLCTVTQKTDGAKMCRLLRFP